MPKSVFRCFNSVVINDMKDLSPEIEAIKHNFMGSQPVKGAIAIYIRAVLDGWPKK